MGDRWVWALWRTVKWLGKVHTKWQRHLASYIAKCLRRKRKRVVVKCLHLKCVPCRTKPMLYRPRIGIKKKYPSPHDPISLNTLHKKTVVSSARTITRILCSSSLRHPPLSPGPYSNRSLPYNEHIPARPFTPASNGCRERGKAGLDMAPVGTTSSPSAAACEA